jgi:hypothetical protein
LDPNPCLPIIETMGMDDLTLNEVVRRVLTADSDIDLLVVDRDAFLMAVFHGRLAGFHA